MNGIKRFYAVIFIADFSVFERQESHNEIDNKRHMSGS